MAAPTGDRPRSQFSAIQLVGVAGLVSTATLLGVYGPAIQRRLFSAPPPAPPAASLGEAEWRRRTYGPEKQSEQIEEWIIRDFFEDMRGGVFLDVGAFDFRFHNNTYYLEKTLGWSGLAVEPQPQFAEGWRRHRPSSVLAQYFASDRTGETVSLHVSDGHPLVASVARAFTERWGRSTVRQVPTITLTNLLDAHHIPRVDFASIDVELAEPRVLAGFDIGRFRPSLVCIEAHPEVRQQILDYFATREYVVVGKYLRIDEKNMYFMPTGHSVRPWPPEVMRTWTDTH